MPSDMHVFPDQTRYPVMAVTMTSHQAKLARPAGGAPRDDDLISPAELSADGVPGGDLWAARTAGRQGRTSFPNPYHGSAEFAGNPAWSHTWFHGSKGEPDFREAWPGDAEEERRKAMHPGKRPVASWPQP